MIHSASSEADKDCPAHIFHVSFHVICFYAFPSALTAGMEAVRKEMDLDSDCSF